jgi:hypothetical protein
MTYAPREDDATSNQISQLISVVTDDQARQAIEDLKGAAAQDTAMIIAKWLRMIATDETPDCKRALEGAARELEVSLDKVLAAGKD